jgi:hypothetical protein
MNRMQQPVVLHVLDLRPVPKPLNHHLISQDAPATKHMGTAGQRANVYYGPANLPPQLIQIAATRRVKRGITEFDDQLNQLHRRGGVGRPTGATRHRHDRHNREKYSASDDQPFHAHELLPRFGRKDLNS